MSDGVVVFDRMREYLMGALQVADLPEGAPPVYVIRDLFGKVGISVSDEFEGDVRLRDALERLTLEFHDRLGAHGRRVETTLLWVWPDLLDHLDDAMEEIEPGVFLADRLTTLSAWWSVEKRRGMGPPVRYTLYSVKGGVGRSTAAAVLARHLARLGEDVLVLDLDLSSPGLGSALFERQARPRFGVTDWFVEELVGQGELVLPEIGASPAWAADLPGTVWVAPAHGRVPGEYLAKLGRVYMDTEVDPWIARLRRLLDGLEARLEPTVVLVDSRSGFHDIGGAAVTDIGAEVLLFGVDSPANWTGYRVLFEHWRALGLARRIRGRLSLVSGLTPATDTERYLARFRKSAGYLVRDCLCGPVEMAAHLPAESSPGGVANGDTLLDPLVIHWSRSLAGGNGVRNLEESVVTDAYAPFLRGFDRLHREIKGEPVPLRGAPALTRAAG